MTKQNTTNEPVVISKQEMMDAISRSGYLIEQRVERTLIRKGYYVETNPAYPDPNTGKSREYDLLALNEHPSPHSITDMGDLYHELTIECVNNPQPIVFFSKDESEYGYLNYDAIKSACIPQTIPIKGFTANRMTDIIELLSIRDIHHYCTFPFSTQYCSFSQKKDQKSWLAYHNDEQHDTFTSLISIIDHRIARSRTSLKKIIQSGSKRVHFSLTYPLVVTQGPLYLAHSKTDDISLTPTNHAIYRTTRFSPKSNDYEHYMIDVVQEQFLSDYLTIIETEMEHIANLITESYDMLMWAVSLLVGEQESE